MAHADYFRNVQTLLRTELEAFPEYQAVAEPVLKQLERRAKKSERIAQRSTESSLARGAWELFMVDWHCAVMQIADVVEEIDGTPFETTVGLLPKQVSLLTTKENFVALNDLGICTKFDKGFPRIASRAGITTTTPDWLSGFENQWIQNNVASGWAIALTPLLYVPYAYDENSMRLWAEVLSGPRFGKCSEYLAFSAKVPHAPAGDDGSCI